MKLKYLGKRKHKVQDYAHRRYVFTKETGYITEVPDEIAVKFIAAGQYLPVVDERKYAEEVKAKQKKLKKGEAICPNCSKVLRSKAGLASHMRVHR